MNSQATPIVVDGVMYLPAANRVVALDPETGTRNWRHTVTGAAPSRRGVAYWPGEGASGAHHLHGRPPAHRARRRHGRARRRIRHERRSRHRRAVQLGAARLQERRRGWREQPAGHSGGARQRARVRCAHRREALGVQLGRRSRAASATTHGRATAGRAASAPTRGRSTSRWTSSAAFYICRSRRRFPAATAAIGRAPISTATPSSPSTFRPARTSGTFRRSITICGMPIRRRRRGSSTSSETDAPIPALALTTKSGYMYILNRETGQPIFGVEERPVPKSDVPGERRFPRSRFR